MLYYHVSEVCRSDIFQKKDPDLAFLSDVITANETLWTADTSVNGETMKFQVDTWTEVTAATELTATELALTHLDNMLLGWIGNLSKS